MHPAGNVLRHSVLLPDQVVRLPHIVTATAQKLLDERKARLRLDKLRERFSSQVRERRCRLREEGFHGRVRIARGRAEVALRHWHRLRRLHARGLLHELAEEHDQLKLQPITR